MGRGVRKSKAASSWRNAAISSVGMTDPCATRSLALASSRVIQSSSRSRISRLGNKAGTGAGTSSGKLMRVGASSADSSGERLIDVGDDVVDVFDADAQAYGLWSDAGQTLFLGRHLPVRRGCRMTGQGLRVA